MITIRLHDAAGATRGRPAFGGDVWGYTYGDGAVRFIGDAASDGHADFAIAIAGDPLITPETFLF